MASIQKGRIDLSMELARRLEERAGIKRDRVRGTTLTKERNGEYYVRRLEYYLNGLERPPKTILIIQKCEKAGKKRN